MVVSLMLIITLMLVITLMPYVCSPKVGRIPQPLDRSRPQISVFQLLCDLPLMVFTMQLCNYELAFLSATIKLKTY